MKLLARFFFLIFSVGMTASCAPITVQYYSVEYIYENRRVDSTGDPTWIEKIVYTFDYEKEGRVTSAFVYENGNETKPIAYLLYTYWDLNELSHQAIDNRLRTVERYSDDDIFKTENGAKVKDPVKSVSKLIRYDVYETDAKDGKCLSVKTYRYNSHDPVIENRNIPMSAKQFKYFSDLSSRFLPEEETVSLFLAGRWVYQSSARIRYEKFPGKKQSLKNGSLSIPFPKKTGTVSKLLHTMIKDIRFAWRGIRRKNTERMSRYGFPRKRFYMLRRKRDETAVSLFSGVSGRIFSVFL